VPLVSEQPSSRKVVTVLGPIAPEELGVTDAHDHLFLRSPALPGQEFDDAERAIEEVAGARSGGLHSIVEVTPIGLGRRPAGMRAVAESTGVHVVAATGYHRDAHYPHGHWVREAPVELPCEAHRHGPERGMHPDDWLTDAPLDSARAGVIKAAPPTSTSALSKSAGWWRRRSGTEETGAAILVHTEIGTSAHGIIDVLTREGVRPERIILAHLDRNPDSTCT